uniref:Uncharacterized protein n=1 Tax=Nelumbo nucifera TaxID=4432 RepID=A0A822Y124_NELNU|nr:TPA_asm: hypothetical protein HUJ06_024801 [Nelumbo nucifera]
MLQDIPGAELFRKRFSARNTLA